MVYSLNKHKGWANLFQGVINPGNKYHSWGETESLLYSEGAELTGTLENVVGENTYAALGERGRWPLKSLPTLYFCDSSRPACNGLLHRHIVSLTLYPEQPVGW